MDTLPTEISGMILRLLMPMCEISKPYHQGHWQVKEAYTNSKRDVLSCALVCRRWRSITLPYLFEDLQLTLGKRRLEDVHGFLRRSSRICSLVVKLCLTNPTTRRLRARAGTNPDNHSAKPVLFDRPDIISFIGILRLLPRLRHLALNNVKLFASLIGTQYPQPSPGRDARITLETLDLHYPLRSDTHLTGFGIIIACFSFITRLRISGIPYQSSATCLTQSQGALPVPEIKVLEMDNVPGTTSALSKLRPPTLGQCRLESLDLGHIDSTWEDAVTVLQDFIEIAGPRLRHLKCNMVTKPSHTMLRNKAVDLSTCVNLRSLTLIYYLGSDKEYASSTRERMSLTLHLLELQPRLPRLRALIIEPKLVGAPAGLDLRDAISDAGISCSETLFLQLCDQGKLDDIIFRGPSFPFTVWSSAYRTGLRLCLPLLRAAGHLLYQEQRLGRLDDVETL